MKVTLKSMFVTTNYPLFISTYNNAYTDRVFIAIISKCYTTV